MPWGREEAKRREHQSSKWGGLQRVGAEAKHFPKAGACRCGYRLQGWRLALNHQEERNEPTAPAEARGQPVNAGATLNFVGDDFPAL